MVYRFALALIGILCCFGQPARGGCRLVVLSYNIHAGIGMDGRHDIERIGSVIEALKPGLVALQEVDRRTERSGGLDLAAELSRITGMQAAFGKAIDFDGGEYGNAVLVRGRILESEIHPIEATPGHEARVILDTRAEVGGCPVPVRLLATHLDHRSAADRERGAQLANRLVAGSPEAAVLAGDLNAPPDSPVLELLRREWALAGEGEPLFTFPVVNPARQIDYILFRPADRWRVVETKVIDEQVASDHRPILAILKLLRE